MLNHPRVSSALPEPELSMPGLREPSRSCAALLMELLALPAVLTELLLVAAAQRVPGSRPARAGTAARWPQGSVRRQLSHAAGHRQAGERVGRERQSSREPTAGKTACGRLPWPEHCLLSVAIVMGTNRRDTGDAVLALA